MAKGVRLIDFAIIILFALAVYLILTRIFGHSATDLAISITLFTQFKVRTINTFSRLKEDITSIKEDIKEIKRIVTAKKARK